MKINRFSLITCFVLLVLSSVVRGEEFRPRTADGADVSLLPNAWGVLATERFMYPVDMADWPMQITSERQLFLDDYLIAECAGLVRRLHHPVPHADNPLLRLHDKRWETGFGHSLFVLQSEQGYRMWYNLRNYYRAENGVRYRGPTCFAVSKDGITWTKPDLGIHRYGENKQNNITLLQGTIDGFFYRPDHPDPQRRYEALVWHDPRGQEAYAPLEGFYRYWSSDGLHWDGDNTHCVIPNGQTFEFPDVMAQGLGDTTNFRWDETLGKYVCNAKILFRDPLLRTVGHSESDDLIHWTRPRMTISRDRLDGTDEMGELTTFPYEGIWIGMIGVYQFPEDKWKQKYQQLAASRDGRNWTRVNPRQAFMPLGPEDSWDSDFTIAGRPGPLLVGDELWFYYWGSRRTDVRDGGSRRYVMHIGLAKLRRDGFVSLDAGDKPGELTTRPLSFSGSRLFVNAAVAEGGSIRAELLTREGEVIEEYSLDDCQPVTRDATRIPVRWSNSTALKMDNGEHVRLKFRLEKAKLYAFWIE